MYTPGRERQSLTLGEGLMCIIHSVSPSILNGEGRWKSGSFASQLPWVEMVGGAYLHTQCVSLYLEWRWGLVSFASPRVRLPLPGLEVALGGDMTEWFICIIHNYVSLYLWWRWWKGGHHAQYHIKVCSTTLLSGSTPFPGKGFMVKDHQKQMGRRNGILKML